MASGFSKRWLQRTRHVLFRLWLITLPITFPFFLTGIFEGVFAAKEETRRYYASIRNYHEETIRANEMDFFSVPGAPGIHDVGLAPYHIPQIRDPDHWWERAGMKRFDIQKGWDNPPINDYASLNMLYKRVRFHERHRPWHHWIYLSDSLLHLEDLYFNGWDRAFEELLKYHYVNPAAYNAGFHYMSCHGGFLCEQWRTRGPALLHLTTETTEDDFISSPEPPYGYARVTARLIEFGIQDMERLALPRDTFPSEFKQLRSVTENPEAWKMFGQYSEVFQWAQRLTDLCERKRVEYNETYARVADWEEWTGRLLNPYHDLSESLQWVRMPTFLTTIMGIRGAEMVHEMVKPWVSKFLGTSKAEEQSEVKEERGCAPAEPPAMNFMDQMLRDFFKKVREDTGEDIQEKMGETEEGRDTLEKLWGIVRPDDVDRGDAYEAGSKK